MHLQLLQNIVSLQGKKFFVLGLLFCSVLSFHALGQEERRPLHSDTPDGLEKVTDLEKPNAFETEKGNTEAMENNIPAVKKEKEQPYKYKGEKEIKSESKSTLSFNLFLYVVDRFKEDN